MLYVIGCILKWIGLLLLALLILLLLLILLVLFLPVRYRLEVEYRETLQGSGWVRWLYPVLEVRLQILENRPRIEIHLLGRSLEKWRKKHRKLPQKEKWQKKHEERPKKEKWQKKHKEPPEIELDSDEEMISEESLDDETEGLDGEVKSLVIKKEEQDEALSDERLEEDSEPADVTSLSRWERFWKKLQDFFTLFLEKLRGLWSRILDLIELVKSIRQRGRRFWEKLQNLWGKWEQLLEIWEQKSTREALLLLWQELKILLKALKPKKLSLWLRYGTGDVYTLAQHLRFLAIVYGLYGEYITIEPEWEEKVLFAKGSLKGRIRIFTFVRVCIKVIRDKNVKYLWKQISEWERR